LKVSLKSLILEILMSPLKSLFGNPGTVDT
jgi:hypothetical protein